MGWFKKLDGLFFITGRSLLGLYFIAPGLSKVFDFASTLALMRMKGVPFSLVLLPLNNCYATAWWYFFNSRKKSKADCIHAVWFNYPDQCLYT